MHKRASGFTLIELLVVIAVIGILTNISAFGFGRYQASARDSQRSSKASILDEALEKYYDNNGEYPGCLSVTGPAATVTSSVLPGLDPTVLITPSALSGVTNSIICTNITGALGEADSFAYVGDSSTACSSGAACLSFTLKYKQESNGSIQAITSRRVTAPTTQLNVIATTNSSSQITASWNSAPEAVTYNLEYASNSSFTGSTFIKGLTGTSQAVTGLAPGQLYYFRVYTVTKINATRASSAVSASTNLDAPSAPTVTATTPSNITTYNWPAIACQAGSTAQYQYRYLINYTGGYTSVWYSPIAGLSSTLDTSAPGYTYTAQVQAQCTNANTTSAWSGTGTTSFYRTGWAQIAVGNFYSCALTFTGKAYCWGGNSSGNLGNGTTTDSLVPVAVTTSGVLSGKTLVAISLNANDTCVLDSAGKAYCWGYNPAEGALGNGSEADSLVPVAVTTSGVLSGKTLVTIATGSFTTCVLDSAGKAYCWGPGTGGSLGDNSTAASSVPVAVTASGVLSGKTLVAIADSGESSCAVDSAGKAYCWGTNSFGEVGNGTIIETNVPVAVTASGVLSGKTLINISLSNEHTCAIDSTGKAYCWGSVGVGLGTLGNGTTTGSNVPVAVTTSGVLSGKTLISIMSGGNYEHTCAIDSTGKAYCWGGNGFGELGNNSTTDTTVPVAVTASGALNGKTLVAIAVGVDGIHTCAIDSTGKAYCWGDNGSGEFGNNTVTSSLVPVLSSLAP